MSGNLLWSASLADPSVSVREVAALSGTTIAAVNRCVDHRVVGAVGGRSHERRLTRHAAYFMAIKTDLDKVGVSPRLYRRLYSAIAAIPDDQLGTSEIELSELLRVDAAPISGVVRRTCRYLVDRDRFIVTEPSIKGGVPVIRGTRVDVYSVQQRLDAGESLEELTADYPEIPAEAFEAARLYAQTHPRRGRPRVGRPAAA